MFSRSTLLHLRVPFSYFLLPIYLFALGISPNLVESRLLWTFLILHLFLYPASNGYNSYFDKDEKSIGGLKHPPPVKKGLYFLSLILDGAAIVLGYIKVGTLFAIMLLVYGLVSKAYSHPAIRLKKYPVGGWLVTGFFQGFFTFQMCYLGMNNFEIENAISGKVLAGGMLTSIMLWANYPMTQVYQHEEDEKHGDRTISMLLGIRGTFLFVLSIFSLVAIGFVFYFKTFYGLYFSLVFLLALTPVVVFFLIWYYRVWRDPARANFTYTMILNFISATCLNGFFAYFFVATSHVDQHF